ncbi:SH3 domain-containing protein [Heliobacterium undosum]|uniref:SH3 domain-containing protein n=1 Tax=Heliomicrobium undosum TaxID=121734 RepID=A0A845L048_9FIRM|nr:N-acetylmuramoyl-L-alanine amidase [Heliomicrobium undosum]MZP28239.1 SH3 domain-containing protein [Heliomicrobium undosum]
MKQARHKLVVCCLLTAAVSALIYSPTTVLAAPAPNLSGSAASLQSGQGVNSSAFTVTVEGQVVNVRTGPGTNYSIITTVNKGQRLTAMESQSGWTRVSLPDGRAGWIADWLIALVTPTTSAPSDPVAPALSQTVPSAAGPAVPLSGSVNAVSGAEKPVSASVNPVLGTTMINQQQKPVIQKDLRAWNATALSPVNIRNGPGMAYDVIRTVPAGESFDLLQVRDGWYQLAQKGQVAGWSASWLFSTQAPAAGTTGVAGSNGVTPSRGTPGTASTRPVAALLSGKTIVIDPGHGNVNVKWNVIDDGAKGSNGTREKDITLDVGRRLADILKARGVNVILTRTADQVIRSDNDLKFRADKANNAKADLYVSIHCDSHTVPETGGTTTYYFYKDDESRQGEGMRMRMAGMVQQSLVAALGRRDIGIKGANFAVLRETTMPAVLVEMMFISNPEEEKLLNQEAVRTKAATAIADGLQRFFEQP